MVIIEGVSVRGESRIVFLWGLVKEKKDVGSFGFVYSTTHDYEFLKGKGSLYINVISANKP